MKITAIILVVVLVGAAIVVGLVVKTNETVVVVGDRIVEESLENLLALDSFNIKSTLDVLSDKGDIILKVDGSFNRENLENIESQGQISLSIEAEDAKQELGLEFKAKDKVFYVNITTIPEMASSLLDQPLIALLKGKWLEFDFETLKQLSGQSFQDSDINSEQTKAFLNDLKNLFGDKTIFAIDQNLGDETIDGDKSAHYKVSVDKEVLKELIPAYINLAKKYASAEQQAFYEENMDQVLKDAPAAIDETWQRMGGIEFDVWIVKSNGYLKRVEFKKSIKNMPLDEEETIDLDIAFSIEFSDFDDVAEVLIPVDTLTLEELLVSQFNMPEQELESELEPTE